MTKNQLWVIGILIVVGTTACGDDRETTAVFSDTTVDVSGESDSTSTTGDSISVSDDGVSQPNADITGNQDDPSTATQDTAGTGGDCPDICGFGQRCSGDQCEPAPVIYARVSTTKKVGLTGTTLSGEVFACTLLPNPADDGTDSALVEEGGCKATIVKVGQPANTPSHLPAEMSVGTVSFSGLAIPRVQLFPGKTQASACVKQEVSNVTGPFAIGQDVTVSVQLKIDLPDNLTTSFASPAPVNPVFGALVHGQPLTLSWDAQDADFVVIGFSGVDPVSQDTGLIVCNFPDTGRAVIPASITEMLPISASIVNSSTTRYQQHHAEPEGLEGAVVEIQGFYQHQQVLTMSVK